jgi:hypothetical protein
MPDNDTPAPTPAPEPTTTEAPGQASSVDLSVLKNISFGPDWSATPSTEAIVRKVGAGGGGKRGSWESRDAGGRQNGGPPRRDRRPTRPPMGGGNGFSGGGQTTGVATPPPFERGRPGQGSRQPWGDRGPRRDGGRSTPPIFQPTLEVLFYPDDAAFRALTKAIRSSCRTYELFEVAHLILQKPERFVVVLRPLPRRDGPPPRVHVAQPDHLPFETEEDAVAHVFEKHLAKFFDTEEVEVEAPKGNFLGVSKCGFTGELLGPPNYHLYPQLLREHHARRLSRMPYEKFAARVELVKEPEQIAAWLEKMKKTTRYKLKEAIEGAPEFFESLDAARQFLLGKKKDAIVRSLETARYPGRMIEQFAPGSIRASVEAVLEQQRRFPLDTANNLRGRLRRMKFNLYKKGAKGVSYVCAVKRSFRTPQTVLADHVQKLITFIEQHPMIPLAKLPQEFLGLPEAPKAEAKVQHSEAAPVATAPAADVAPVSANAEAPTEAAIPTAEAPAGEVVAAPSAEAPAAEEKPAEAPVVAEAAPAPAPVVVPEAAVSHYTPEQQLQLRELLMNLRWLVSEGYVTEYGDGKLYAPPVLLPPKPKAPGAEGVEAGATATDEIHEVIEEHAEIEEEGVEGLDEAEVETLGEPLGSPTTENLAAPEAPPAASEQPAPHE